MAGPWEAYQDATALQLARTDQTIAAPPRAPVQSSKRVWGDDEAVKNGLYDAPAGPWTAFQKQPTPAPQTQAPLKITVNPVSSRFDEMQPPQSGGERLQEGLNRQTLELTRGPQLSPSAQMAGDMANLLPAASQGTTPHIDQYGGQIVSTETFEDDGGNVLYRDPQTGQVRPTDNTKHVALRDPVDGRVKVFNRTEATNENAAVGVSRVLSPGLAAGAPTRLPVAAAPAVSARRERLGVARVNASDFVAAADPHYKAADAALASINIPGEYGTPIVNRIKSAISASGQPADIEAVKEVHSIVSRIASETKPLTQFERLQAEMNGVPATPPKPAAFTADRLKNVREELGLSVSSPNPRTRAAARAAVAEIDKIIGHLSPGASKSLATANNLNTTSHELASFDSMAGRAGTQESFKLFRGNTGERMRRYLGSVVDKADELLARKPGASTKGKTGFSNDEVDAFREFVNARSALRNLAEASPTKGLLRMGAEAAAAAHFGPIAAAIPAIGLSANILNKVLDAAQLGRIRELIAKRSPHYAQAVKSAVDRYTKAQADFAIDPSPNRLAAYVSASRALSSGLTRDGIEVTSGQLLKQIAGQPPATAEEQQPPVSGVGR